MLISKRLLLLNLDWLPINETIKSILLDVYSIYLKSLNLLDRINMAIPITSLC